MFELFKEISVFQADLIKSFAIFFLLLVGNYVSKSIFTCVQITYIQKHKLLQLFISFFLFYFLVTLVSETGKLEFTPPIEKLLYSFFYFIGFLVLMRLDMRISVLVLLLVFTIYFLELNKEFYLEKASKIDEHDDRNIYESNRFWITLNCPTKIRLIPVRDYDFKLINKLESIIYYVIVFLLVIGFISYGGEIHDTVRKADNLTWIDVITDTSICSIKNRKSFLHYLKVGLGLKI